jgi:16S rRNA G527 N7-methylase RsmG
LGVPAAARPGLERYLDLLADWSARVNLTGAKTPATRVALLVGEALPAADLVLPGRLLDVGSGNGSPGLVRRWAFLREACRAAGRPDVEVLRARHDAWPGPPASTVTVRGLDLPLSALASLVQVGGRLVRFGRRRPVEPGWRAEPSPPGLQAFRREPVSRET